MSGENPIIDPLIRDLMDKAATGEAAKMFLRSGLGKHITARATQEADEAICQLIVVDPNRTDLVLALQNQIKVAAQALTWLAEAISEGDNALNQLEENAE